MLSTDQITRIAVLTALAGAYVVPAQASNLTITPTFAASITSLPDASAVEASINQDISNIENDITANNPVSVSILFQGSSSGLGGSLTQDGYINYSTYRADLQANPNKTSIVNTALATLPAGPNTGINNATQVVLTAANFAAIGETAAANYLVGLNGGYNSTISLNFSQLNDTRPDANSSLYDLQSVAGHEIDEVLGIGGSGSQLYQSGPTAPSSLPTSIGALDLYRYSAPGVRSFTYSSSATAYFSIDGGTTNLVNFNQQGANGADFGDWGNSAGTRNGNNPPQLQDAFGTPGAAINLGVNELTALNAIGWNLTPDGLAAAGLTSPVPVPSAAWLMFSGLFGLLGLSRRKVAS